MSFSLHLNRVKWFGHLAQMDNLFPGYLPVIKGNGYGFGNSFLAQTALAIGKTSIAAGTVDEARQLAAEHDFNEIFILTPVINDLVATDFVNFVFTVADTIQLDYITSLARQFSVCAKIVIKCRSTMQRFGFDSVELSQCVDTLAKGLEESHLEIMGYSLHFPLERTSTPNKLAQIDSWFQTLQKLGLACNTMFLSHLSSETLLNLTEKYPHSNFVMRLGTQLWLYDKAFQFHSTVLAVHPVKAGQRFGYKQRRAWRSGYLIYLSGGSANGVGLEAPSHVRGYKGRLKLTLFWLFHLFNLYLSPFVYKGHRLWFAEPPHMQTSVLKIPGNLQPPKIGEAVTLKNLRMTIASFDKIIDTSPETLNE